jgi:hypothetical protein
LNEENQINNQWIGELSGDIATLAQTVNTLTKQLTLINTKEQSMRDMRAEESATQAKRITTNARVLEVIQ